MMGRGGTEASVDFTVIHELNRLMFQIARSPRLWYLAFGLLLAGVLMFLAYRYYNKPHREVWREEAAYRLHIDDIFREFQTDEAVAFEKYNSQVIELLGTYSRMEGSAESDILLLTGTAGNANCLMQAHDPSEYSQLEEGQEVRLKGLFVGYDDLLSEIQLRDCRLVE
jgi:hypothetical protein